MNAKGVALAHGFRLFFWRMDWQEVFEAATPFEWSASHPK